MRDIDASLICQIARNGKEALRILDALDTLPDLIFLDINMPVMNGLECLKKLRSDSKYDHIPISMLTTSFNEAEHARKLGADLFLTKPPSFRELRDVLHEAFYKKLPPFFDR